MVVYKKHIRLKHKDLSDNVTEYDLHPICIEYLYEPAGDETAGVFLRAWDHNSQKIVRLSLSRVVVPDNPNTNYHLILMLHAMD